MHVPLVMENRKLKVSVEAKVDALGNPLKFSITAGQRNDITQAEALLKDVVNALVIADKGYDSKKIRLMLIRQNCVPIIPTKSNTKEPWESEESFLALIN
jgi:transposase